MEDETEVYDDGCDVYCAECLLDKYRLGWFTVCLKGGENMDMASMVWEQATCMNQIRFYQLRMMEQPMHSEQREVYKELIRDLQLETQKTLLEVNGCE